MKYYWIKLTHDKGTSYLKTSSTSKEQAIKNTMAYENCPKRAIECKEISKELFSLDIKTHFKNTL